MALLVFSGTSLSLHRHLSLFPPVEGLSLLLTPQDQGESFSCSQSTMLGQECPLHSASHHKACTAHPSTPSIIIDTGCTRHVVGSPLHHLCVCRRVIPLHSLITADRWEIKSTIVADLEATYLHEGQQVPITLSDVTLVDSFDSLLSVSALTTKSDMLVAFNKDECHLYHELLLVGMVPKQHGLYMLELQAQQPIEPTDSIFLYQPSQFFQTSWQAVLEAPCQISA